ncbi:unnamed protein product [Caenorhabditis sp. 36 PRJEB53466]|nr:unnamed protein product [Caenorhabditis sp. 36 PRJEB53466]
MNTKIRIFLNIALTFLFTFTVFGVKSPSKSRNISSKLTNSDFYYDKDRYMNSEQWQCGTTWNLGLARVASESFCWDKATLYNMCCAVHDDCYKLHRDKDNCDKHFCKCLDDATQWKVSVCFDALKNFACMIVVNYGHKAYEETWEPENNIQYTPALNQTAKKYYMKLYTACPDIEKTLSNCAYNHLICHLQMLPDRYPHTYEDCVDQVIECLDQSSLILVDNFGSCRAAVEGAMRAISLDAEHSGFKVLREAKGPSKWYAPKVIPIHIQD